MNLPKLARALLTLIGKKLLCVKIISANFNESAIVLVIALLRKFISETFSLFETFIMKMAFFH